MQQLGNAFNDRINTRFFELAFTILLTLFSLGVQAQETNTNVSGIIKSSKKEILVHATVTAVHEPTKNTYSTITNSKGYFHFFNIRPGGPYTITVSYVGYETLSKSNLYFSYSGQNFYSYLQGSDFSEIFLQEKIQTLGEVIIKGNKQREPKYGVETNIDKEMINILPSISRNLQDYVRQVPNARVNGDGMMSLGGQNNKYNAFFIDGSNYNDVLGLALSGTSGGQTGAPPISIEAIEEIKVSQSPFDVQYSNFTGGSINAITKSGSNEYISSAWFFFRNEKMAGKSPVPVEVVGSPGAFKRTQLSSFFNQTSGFYSSGPLVKNKLFYFLLAEIQSERQPQDYDFAIYKGSVGKQQLIALADTLRSRYNYEPGSFLQTTNELDVKRFMIKFEWNPGVKNKFSASYRHNNGERVTPQMQNGSTVIRFSNNRYLLPSKTYSASFEWKRYFRNSANNRMLVTFNREVTSREIIGQPFPTITIDDGAGSISFGSNGTGQVNRFSSSEVTLLNIYRFVKGKHALSAGLDGSFGYINDVALSANFGLYRYNKLEDFVNKGFPSRYSRTYFSNIDPSKDAFGVTPGFNTIRAGAFINNEIQVNQQFKLTTGIRIDANMLPSKYGEDVFFNSTAKPEIEKYYDLNGALSGKLMKIAWQLSPRLGFNYKIHEEGITIRGGAGVFTGHILNVWASPVYMDNIENLNISPQQYGLYFNPDPFNQPNNQTLSINPEKSRGSVILVSGNYKYPSIFKTTLSIDKSFEKNGNILVELYFTKNLYENLYVNVNLLPPSLKSSFPGSRNIFSGNSVPDKIFLPGGNPYDNIILLDNNKGKKGYAYGFTTSFYKMIVNNLHCNLSYSFGNAVALFEPGGTANTNDGQWSRVETVNGKNYAKRSVSDFDLGHRLSALVSRKWNYGTWSTLLTFVYNGQSGLPYSYVYSGSLVNDLGQQPQFNADLIYIPTMSELDKMIFITNAANNIQPQLQKDYLNDFIENDEYLRKHRGQFADRNGSRLPFSHTVDVRLQHSLLINIRKRKRTLTIIYDIFNFTNLLNKNWGRIYFLPNDNYALIRFAGFVPNSLTPQYQFRPLNGAPWSIQNSTAPGSSARWTSQLGLKVTF